MAQSIASASDLFREKHCDTPGCTAMVPDGTLFCRSCARTHRRSAPAVRGRFEARVQRMMVVARLLDQAEADYRSQRSEQTHAALMVAFSDYRRAVRLLDRS